MPNNAYMTGHLYIRVAPPADPTKPSYVSGSYGDDSMGGVTGPSNAPYGNLRFKDINSPGRQWIRDYCFALCRELLGLIRSKFESIPIPNSEVRLNGDALVTQAREDKEKLVTQMLEFLSSLTRDKLAEVQAQLAENMSKQLKYIPIPKMIWIG
jgi:hypothetical protein